MGRVAPSSPDSKSDRTALILLVLTAVADILWLIVRPHASGGWAWPALMAALGFHLATVVRESRRPTLNPGAVMAAVALVLAVAVALPPAGSKDLYSYAFAGRMVAVHHANPYLTRPDAFPDDPLLSSVAHSWRRGETVYGPVFTFVSAVGAVAYGTSPTSSRIFFEGLEALAVIAALRMLIARRATSDVLVFLGLFPAVGAVVNGGHNDLLTGVLLLGGVLFMRDRRAIVAGCLLAAAIMVKLLVLPAVALVLVAALVSGRRSDAWRAGAVAFGGTVVGYLLVGGPAALAPLTDASQAISRGSVWHGISVVESLGPGGPGPTVTFVRWIALLATVLLGIAFVGRMRRTVDLAAGAVGGMLILLLTTQYVLPWYSALMLPVAGLISPRFRLVAWAQASLLLTVYVVPPGLRIAGVPTVGEVADVAPYVQIMLLVIVLFWWPLGRSSIDDGNDSSGPGHGPEQPEVGPRGRVASRAPAWAATKPASGRSGDDRV